jgi:hypothetical protein
MVGAEFLLSDLQGFAGDDGTIVLTRMIEGHRFLIESVPFSASALRANTWQPCAQQQQRQYY